MGQQEVLELLEKAKKELTSKQISKKIGVCLGATTRALRNLAKQGLIKFTIGKHRLRKYIIN